MPAEEGRPGKANRGPIAGPSNRRALLAAAREVYRDVGFNAPFSAVARRAGVGQGSLYRHFPDRIALGVALFEENVAVLESLVVDPTGTLDDLLDLVVAQAVVSTAFIDLLAAHATDQRVIPLGARYRDVVEALVERDRRAGRVAADVDADDVLIATDMLATAIARADPPRRDAVARRARIIVQPRRPQP